MVGDPNKKVLKRKSRLKYIHKMINYAGNWDFPEDFKLATIRNSSIFL